MVDIPREHFVMVSRGGMSTVPDRRSLVLPASVS